MQAMKRDRATYREISAAVGKDPKTGSAYSDADRSDQTGYGPVRIAALGCAGGHAAANPRANT